MAEALGAISSTITILDLAFKLQKCGKRIEAAPGVWREYCNKVKSLSHVHNVLMDMISGQNHAVDRLKSEELATLADKEIQIIVKQANNILGACKDLARSPRKRVWDWLRVKRASVKFVIAEKGLQGLIDSVEKAKASLQAAVCLCGLEKLNASQTQMQDTFQLLHDRMKEQSKALQRLNRNMKLSKLSLELVEKREQPGKPPRKNKTSTKVPRHKPRRSRSSNKGGVSAGNDHRRKKGSTKARHNGQAAGGYEIVLRDKKVFIMATDTDEYKSITREVGTDAHTTGLIPVERKLEDMSDDEWEGGLGNRLYEFQLPPPSNSVEDPESEEDSNSLHTDLSNDTMPIRVHYDKQSRAFVEEGTNLCQCDQGETKSMLFCVSHIWMNETNQTFTFREPCLQPCHHVKLQFLNESLTARDLPFMMEIQFISRVVPFNDTVMHELAWEFTLQSYHRCPDGWPCSHTLIGGALPWQDGITTQKVVCLVPGNLKAAIYGYGWKPDSATQNSELARDDDDCALNLLQKVKRKDPTIPGQIPFGVLVGYLKLIEGLRLEEEYLAQCCIWTDAILPEVATSFDDEAIAWTWVLWKLQRGTEFKRLTGIIQQQGKHLIDQETNRYGVVLPQKIIRAIDQKRILVLSQIRDLVQNSIETGRRNYKITRTQDDPSWTAPLKIMSSSLIVGYLTLEYETFLLDGRTWDDGNFDGVSFADASGWIRSMMDLGNWMAKPVSPSVHKMPFALSSLMTILPTVGARVYEDTVSTYLSSDVYKSLNDLVRRLEEEGDWGVDLIDE